MLEELATAIRERHAILFVGSGVSATLGVPTWRGLIDHMADDLQYDRDLFASSANNFMALAEYYRLSRDGIGPLRSWMDTNWSVSDDKLRESRVHTLIARLAFPLLYTTNYDRFLERSLTFGGQKVTKIVTVRDLLKVREGDVQVVKLHGDFDSDESIVLTETDYFRRLSFEAPLDIKLRADTLGKTVLFIGYSLADINIRLLLFKLTQAWESAGQANHRPTSYLFLSHPDPIQEAVLGKWGVRLITGDADSPDQALCEFLEKLAVEIGR